jgi:hypothetical protein
MKKFKKDKENKGEGVRSQINMYPKPKTKIKDYKT